MEASTYYTYQKRRQNPTTTNQAAKKPGRKKPGYSLDRQGRQIPDHIIEKWLVEAIEGDGYPYGYRKLTVELREQRKLIVNHKKVYRLCKELQILRPKRERKPYRPGKVAHKRKPSQSNQQWEIDLKYGYLHQKQTFFYQMSIIDIFDRSIVESHIGLSAKATDAVRIVRIAAKNRNIQPGQLTLRSDNGPQFRAKQFVKTLKELGITHERTPINSPNLNAYIEAFHSVLEDECYNQNEFETFQDAYEVITDYLTYYNYRRRHGSIGYNAPMQYYWKHQTPETRAA